MSRGYFLISMTKSKMAAKIPKTLKIHFLKLQKRYEIHQILLISYNICLSVGTMNTQKKSAANFFRFWKNSPCTWRFDRTPLFGCRASRCWWSLSSSVCHISSLQQGTMLRTANVWEFYVSFFFFNRTPEILCLIWFSCWEYLNIGRLQVFVSLWWKGICPLCWLTSTY